jgi:ribosomal protein L20A (L18A)
MTKKQTEEEERKFIFTTKIVDDITSKINDGVVIKRFQNPWFKSEAGLRKSGLTFRMAEDEIQEYIRCKIDIHYFAEKYCRIKTEDGSIQNIQLRDYQKDILDLYTKNRFSILMGSRQIGKTINSAITMLHYVTFNNDKNIMIVANIASTTIEIIDKIKSIYQQLPFFLKVGLKNWNQRTIIFENGCRIKSSARSKTPAIGFTIDFLYLDEFAHIPSNIIEPYYTAVFPVVSAVENSKIVITSTPNGMNLFYKLLSDAERPDGDPLKNNYKAKRVYWYQVPGRFVTYLRLNAHRMYEANVTKEDLLEQIYNEFDSKTKVELKFNSDLMKDVIHIFNNESCSDKDIRQFQYIKDDREIPIQSLCEVTTWKEEAIKDIGGEDAFNQEYGLRFVNATRSLLEENLIEFLINNKVNYVYRNNEILENKLKFSYDGLKWIDNPDIFSDDKRKNIKGIISVDISEGLGQDYSIINIFKISPKSQEFIDQNKFNWTHLSDFFCLEQIGIYRSNIISVKQLAELFYLLVFEYFDYENFKVVLELNNYGNEFLAHLPHVFDGNNNYGSNVFFRYKHRADAVDEKIGLKVGENKNMLVKEYQDSMSQRNFIINNEETINEITCFVKHITPSGNIRYAADVGHDDCVMTLVNTSSIFQKHSWREVVEDYAPSLLDSYLISEYQNFLRNNDYVEVTDYRALLNVRKQRRMYEQYQAANIKNLNSFR